MLREGENESDRHTGLGHQRQAQPTRHLGRRPCHASATGGTDELADHAREEVRAHQRDVLGQQLEVEVRARDREEDEEDELLELLDGDEEAVPSSRHEEPRGEAEHNGRH